MTNYPPPVTSAPWSVYTKRTITLLCLAALFLLFLQITDVLPLLVVSAVLAFLLYPLTTALENRILSRLPGKRTWAILLTYVLVFLLLLLAILVIFPAVFSSLASFMSDLPDALNRIQTDLTEWLSQPLMFRGETVTINGEPLVPLEQLNQVLGNGEELTLQNVDLLGAVRGFVSSLTGPAFSALGTALQALVNLLFVLMIMFYLLKDGASFADRTITIVPEGYRDDTRRLMYELAQVWNAYLRGQLILNVFIGVMTFLVASLLGLPNALALGLLAGLLEFVPNLGPLLAMAPAALLALLTPSSTLPFLSGPTFAVVVIIAYIAIQNVEAVLIVPRVMGGSLNLHPVVIVLGVLAGASLAGALGVILAAPVIASTRVIGQYIYGKLLDKPMFLDTNARQDDGDPFAWLKRIRYWIITRLRRLDVLK